MQPADFNFELPPDLIAQVPLAERPASRLLQLLGNGVTHGHVRDLPALLRPGDLLVVNDTRVVPARIHGTKESGGRIEMLLERLLDPCVALVQLRASHAPRPGTRLLFPEGNEAEVIERRDEFYVLRFGAPVSSLLEKHGHIPLPPYIRRSDAAADRERYQTVYARAEGSVAAPTAGLHFDATLLDALRAKGIGLHALTLHVGAGTFAPLRPHQLKTGRLHAERLEVSPALCDAVADCRERGGRVVAVGTTVMRGLETAADASVRGLVRPFDGDTTLFVRPGYDFRVGDALLTNFHLPQSSLLMLVCAFGGTTRVLEAYRQAVAERYRFYSYGDAMFLERAHAV